MRRETGNGGRRHLLLFLWSVAPFFLSPVSCLPSPVSAFAAKLPSVFRGVVVADSPLGVRVVSVEETSQASFADLRPEDVIVRVQGRDIRSIDEFALLSNALKGQTITVALVVFRNGTPLELTLQLYSYPLAREWGLEIIPDFELRFAQPQTGLDYWQRLGRGFENADKSPEALQAYLNGLHYVPTDVPTALKVGELFTHVSQQHLKHGDLARGVSSLRQALLVMEHLFDFPLQDEQLQTLKTQLQDTLHALHAVSKQPKTAA